MHQMGAQSADSNQTNPMVLRVAKYSRCISWAQRITLGVRHGRSFTSLSSQHFVPMRLPGWLQFSPANLLQCSGQTKEPQGAQQPPEPGSSAQPTPGGCSEPIGEKAFHVGMRQLYSGHALQAIPFFEEAATAGYLPAHLFLFRLYSGGLYSPRANPEKAASEKALATSHFHYFKSEMETKGTPESHLHMGYCYMYGLGCPEDREKAAQEMKIAAVGGNPLAQFGVGVFYQEGRRLPKDLELAINFFSMAADNGAAFAQFSLATIPSFGEKNPQEANRLLHAAADQGLPSALLLLAFRAETDKDFKSALKYFLAAAEAEDDRGYLHAGFYFETGSGGCGVDQERAFKYYMLATEYGNLPEAHSYVATCYSQGIGVTKSDEKALHHFTLAAEKGDARAQTTLGIYFQEKDPPTAFKWYKLAAEQGFVRAQANLGLCYSLGLGVEENPELSFAWTKAAADRQNPRAQFNVGYCYERGYGVPQDEALALTYYILAAEGGEAEALPVVGNAYLLGILGAKQDSSMAIKYFEMGANKDHPGSMYELALCYGGIGQQGADTGVPKDDKKAFELLSKASDLGLPAAQGLLGMFYLWGKAVQKDEKKAFEMVQKGAQNGDPEAKCHLGLFYGRGIGTPKDPKEAIKWLKLSAAQGNQRAKEAFELILQAAVPVGGANPTASKVKD